MFTNQNTIWLEVLVIVLVLAFLGFVIGRYIYKRVNHLPTGDCECCHKSKQELLDEYHKCYCKSK